MSTVLDVLIEKESELRHQKLKIDDELDKVQRMILGYLSKNGLNRAETDTHTVSVVETYTLAYIDRDRAYDYLKKQGLWDKMQRTQFDANAVKKYCAETGDTLEGTVELTKNQHPKISAKAHVGGSHGETTHEPA